MIDLFENSRPVHIEKEEWWFNLRIIVKQDDLRLPTWISFPDFNNSSENEIHNSKSDAIKLALQQPFLAPDNLPVDYIGNKN